MPASRSLVVARLLWIVPIVLFALAAYQADVAMDLRSTLLHGKPATATVTDFEFSDRVDVSYDYVSLAVEIDGQRIVHERMSLPHSFAPLVRGYEEIEVLVQPGADQEIVIRDLGRAHYRIAAINAAMALVLALMLGAGVGAWNRFLHRKGDPAAMPPSKSSGAAA